DWAGPGPVVEDSVGPGPVVQDSVGPGSAGHDPVGSRPATGEAGPGGHRADGGARRGPAARPARAGQPGRAAARLWPTAGERSAPVLLALLVGALVVAGGWALLPGTPPTGAPSGAAATTTPSRTAGQDHPLPANLLGQVRIRPVTAPTLCLTDGRVLDRRYTPLVAVQRPCDEVSPQTTTIQPTGEGTYRIRWDHPDYGPGCLVVLTDGPGIGLLEPWDDCVRASHFRIEPSGSYDGGTYVLRVVGNGCAGIRQSSTEAGTEVVMERCVGRGGQVFVIEPAFRSGPT
ncbi:RICIN domain-containing protein, partial [Micromonospora rosaria]|uniref:RICIN domain-containing protein n=2 Tax=Micromonospora rosaria TaxID=47874 RepID=UPI000A597EC8